MPQYNVWANPFDPTGSQLSGVIKRGRDYVASTPKRKFYETFGDSTEAPSKKARTQELSRAGTSNKYRSMPRFSRRYPRRTRRTYRRKANRRWRRSMKAFAPHERVVKCTVCANLSIASTTGAMARQNPRINDITDVFGSAGTEQPLYFDQWAALYDKAVVLGSKLEVWFENTGTTSVLVGIMRMSEDEGVGTSYNDYEYCIERGTKFIMLSPEDDRGYLSMKTSNKKHLHIKDLKDAAEQEIDLSTPTGPSNVVYYNLWGQSVDKATSNTIQCVIKVTYVVLLKDRKVVARSVA